MDEIMADPHLTCGIHDNMHTQSRFHWKEEMKRPYPQMSQRQRSFLSFPSSQPIDLEYQLGRLLRLD
jgi:hypothetical protein